MALTSITPHAGRVYVKALLTTNIASLSGAQTIDGVALVAGDLVGALGQTSATTRAVYVVQTGAWLIGDPGIGTNLEVQALDGTLNKNAVYGCDTTGAITWGTTSVTFTLKSSTGTAFNPAAPGELGGTTPGDATFKDTRFAVGNGTATASRLVLNTSADFAQLSLKEPSGGSTSYGSFVTTATAFTRKRIMIISLADGASTDITTTVGGFASIVAPATADSGAFFSFLANGTASTNGLTFTSFAAADTANKLCAFASGGKLRIRNRLGSTQTVMLELTEAMSA